MNQTQLAAATAVERHRAQVRELSDAASEARRKVDQAERALKRAQARLRSAIREDPESWNSVTAVPDYIT
jgi:hypothetical protein